MKKNTFCINYDNPVVQLDKHVLGKRVRDCRKMRGLCQEELGLAINSDQKSIYLIESGKWLLSLTKLIRICNALEYPVARSNKSNQTPSALGCTVKDR